MWELDCKESWALKKWSFWIVVLEKTLESPLDSWKIHPVNSKGNQPWIFIHGTDWCWSWSFNTLAPDMKSQLIGKYLDAGKDWRQEKGTTEDEMVGWDHQINGHEFEQTLGEGEGQRNLACCSPWGWKRIRHDLATEQQQHAKRTTIILLLCDFYHKHTFVSFTLKKYMSYCIILNLNVFFCQLAMVISISELI